MFTYVIIIVDDTIQAIKCCELCQLLYTIWTIL